ncbi:MAG: GTP cyclohydrolase I FolE2 [Thaumarchaeota archaeon]|nr:GTP cyclohydrolase I FolE2 [Nitrososphaerota archaeon]
MRRATNDDEQIAKTQFIDLLADTQIEPAELVIDAGVADLKVLYQNGKIAMPVLLTIQTSTGMHRGVHMSRLVQAASSKHGASIESWLKAICSEVNKTQPGARVACTFEMPHADQFIPVIVKTSEKGAIRYQFTAKGMTACPCSKRMIGIGHMQRAEITMVLEKQTALDSTATIEKMGECFSAIPTERMKRVEEARKILEAQENARFAEDLVRECVKRFPNALYVRSRCFESIHAHDAVATWSKSQRSAPL